MILTLLQIKENLRLVLNHNNMNIVLVIKKGKTYSGLTNKVLLGKLSHLSLKLSLSKLQINNLKILHKVLLKILQILKIHKVVSTQVFNVY